MRFTISNAVALSVTATKNWFSFDFTVNFLFVDRLKSSKYSDFISFHINVIECWSVIELGISRDKCHFYRQSWCIDAFFIHQS